MTIKALYPNVRPTLNLDFAKTKALDPRVTFTRASTATFFGADGLIKTAGNNVPRFDHNPTTGESLGLLVEEARTNFVRRSTGPGLFAYGVTTVNGFTGTITPGETYTSSAGGQFRLIAYTGSIAYFTAISGDQNLGNTPLISISATITSVSSVSSQYNVSTLGGVDLTTESVTGPDGVSVNLSVPGWGWSDVSNASIKSSGTGAFATAYVRPRLSTTVANFRIEMVNGGDGDIGATFTLSTGTLGSISGTGSGNAAVTATALPNGWYRFTWGRSAMTGTAPTFSIRGRNSSDATVSASMHVAFAQVEVGSFPTSYIATTGATVTRAADVASMTGTNFSSWYRQDEGTWLGAISTLAGSSGRLVEVLGPSGFSTSIRPRASSSRVDFARNTSGAQQINGITFPAKIAGAYNSTALQGAANGTLATAVTSGSLVNSTYVEIGAITSENTYLGGTIARLAFYSVRLPDAQLQALTAT